MNTSDSLPTGSQATETTMDGEVWNISNPSDHYTIVGDFEAVACATLLLGQGGYGLQPLSGDHSGLPIFLFGGFDAWAKEQWPTEGFGDVLTRRRTDIADALDTVLIGDRALFEKSGMTWEAWQDHHRSSLNDIGTRARKMAQHMRNGDDHA